jgi:hypothetical protein
VWGIDPKFTSGVLGIDLDQSDPSWLKHSIKRFLALGPEIRVEIPQKEYSIALPFVADLIRVFRDKH